MTTPPGPPSVRTTGTGETSTHRFSRGRARTSFVLALVLVAGVLVSRKVPGDAGDIGGDVLYAIAFYLGLVVLLPRLRPVTAAGCALAWCWAVEGLQATGINATIGERFPPARWVLGTGFNWRDLLCYALGVAAVCALDVWIHRRGRRAQPATSTP